MCSRVPCATTHPASMMTSRSQYAASSRWWVVTRTPAPAAAAPAIDSQGHPRAGVDAGGGLVQDEQLRPVCKRRREGQAAAQAVGDGADHVVTVRLEVRVERRGGDPKARAEKSRFSATVRSSHRPRPWGT